MSVIDTLIFDRTAEDVENAKNLAKDLAKKIKNGEATQSDIDAWNAGNLKGCYNLSDIRRITAAMTYIQTAFSALGITITLTLSTADINSINNATNSTIFDSTFLAKIISSLNNVKNSVDISTPAIPSSFNYLNYITANNIEKMLFDVYTSGMKAYLYKHSGSPSAISGFEGIII